MAAAPTQTAGAARTQAVFRVLMRALSSPGEWLDLPDGRTPQALIGATLLDLETTFYTPDAALHARLLDTGAVPADPHDAAYVFLPELDQAALDVVAGARRGDALEPQGAATLIVAAGADGPEVNLTGPGIPGTRRAALGVPGAFLNLRRASAYPLGWDAFLIRGQRVCGLPRTTAVEVT